MAAPAPMQKGVSREIRWIMGKSLNCRYWMNFSVMEIGILGRRYLEEYENHYNAPKRGHLHITFFAVKYASANVKTS